MSKTANFIIGVDVGGTFTDVFFFDQHKQQSFIAKVPSTVEDQSRGFMAGIVSHVPDLSEVSAVIHGTTVGTNALLERKGARTGLLTTAGFRDSLEMRRRDRPQTWGLWGNFQPLVARDLRLEVDERMLASGEVHRPLDVAQVRTAAQTLLDKGAEAISIVFVNAYANAEHEAAAYEAVRQIWPNDYINVSSQILPEIREFERGSTTAINAYLQPKVSHYLQRLEDTLRERGFAGQVFIVQSNGGVMTVQTAQKYPYRTALSGPAAGVIAGQYICAEAGFPNIITADVGGTSFDVSLVAGGQQTLTQQATIDFGLVIRTPMIEITTIGAGGGSIASLDRGGLLQVGPESAGSNPGPVCYGLGNKRPTVTDAHVVLGRINAERPIGGQLTRLDVAAAEAAIEEQIARPLGMSVMAAAEAILTVANAKMAGALRLVSIEKGHDPQKFALVPFGGGGSLHVSALMKAVGLAHALVPRYPGITSALGCVIADMRHDFVQTLNRPLAGMNTAELLATMSQTAAQGQALLQEAEITFAQVQIHFELDMSYSGQTHTVAVPLAVDVTAAEPVLTEQLIREAFEATYLSTYGRLLGNIPVRILSLRTAVIGQRPKFDLLSLAPTNEKRVAECRVGERPVWFEGGWHNTPIYQRLALPTEALINGPAILEQTDTTIVIEPGLQGRVDRFGNVIISRCASR